MKTQVENRDWRWPERGQDETELLQRIKGIRSPYDGEKPAVCYPGTPLTGVLPDWFLTLAERHLNAIGSHTHGEEKEGVWRQRTGEGGFEDIQEMESQAIWMIASMVGGSPKETDGYFCGGGTEANEEGMWIGREWLKQHPDPHGKGIVVFASPLHHYSIAKSSDKLGLGSSSWGYCTKCHESHLFLPDPSGSGLNVVGMNADGTMSVAELEKAFRQKYAEGYRRFLIAATVGLCLSGAIDPIREIADFIRKMEKETGARFYLHVDASFAGFTIPFVNPELEFGFTIPEVMSLTLDGDKMGRLPYPAGIFLCRKNLMSLVARRVQYVRGHEDDTVAGSRSCLAPVLAWFLFQKEGVEGQRQYVRKCLDRRDYLVRLVKNVDQPWLKVFPHSPWVNFAPLKVDIKSGKIPKSLCDKGGYLESWQLRDDFFPGNTADVNSCPITVYKVCVMPHVSPAVLERLVQDLIMIKKEWE